MMANAAAASTVSIRIRPGGSSPPCPAISYRRCENCAHRIYGAKTPLPVRRHTNLQDWSDSAAGRLHVKRFNLQLRRRFDELRAAPARGGVGLCNIFAAENLCPHLPSDLVSAIGRLANMAAPA